MPFNWQEYLILARWLQANEPPPGIGQEAAFRCAVSRAYYAAFNHASNYARDYLRFQPRMEAEDHGRLRSHLKQSRRQRTAAALDRLREWRNACDYHDPIDGDLVNMLNDSINESQYVFTSLPPPNPPAGAASSS